MKDFLKGIEVKKLVDDYNKCDYYLDNLTNGNINYLEDAIIFSEKTYDEFCIKDPEITAMNTNPFTTNLDKVSQTIQNLIALKKMITEHLQKNTRKEQ